MKYHVNPETGHVGQCEATVRDCKFVMNGELPEHYATKAEADQAVEKMMDNKHGMIKILHKDKRRIDKKNITAVINLAKNNSYYNVCIDNNDIGGFIDSWRDNIGDDKAKIMEDNKVARDGDYSFHATVVTPKELRNLRKQGVDVRGILSNRVVVMRTVGIGKAIDNDKEAWFIVLESDDGNKIRQELGLPKHDFHITLGFINGDVHTKSKGRDSLQII